MMLVQKDEEWENFSLLFYFYVLKLWRGEQRGGKFLNSKIKDESVDFLFQAVLSLKTVEAVSYTHLDVYKRQVLRSALR